MYIKARLTCLSWRSELGAGGPPTCHRSASAQVSLHGQHGREQNTPVLKGSGSSSAVAVKTVLLLLVTA